MSWFFWAFLSLISSSLEEVIDKIIIIKEAKQLDPLISSFYRNVCFFFFVLFSGIIGIFGKVTFFWNVHIFILALCWPIHSLAYDYFLRNVELSRFQSVYYIFPFIYLFLDKMFFHTSYSLSGVTGLTLLVSGAFIFSLDSVHKISKFTFKKLIWMIAAIIPYIYMLIIFKLFGDQVNEVSFYFSIWSIVIIFYILLLFFSGNIKKLFKTATIQGFFKKTIFSKCFDFMSSIFYLRALLLTSLTNVSAITSFYPIVLLTILIVINFFTKIDVGENFSPKIFVKKIIGAIIITIGAIFMYK